ncbi:MAG: 16S rRNA (cytosine(1402)-N(4))-methyltransferase RsmH [Spirochaetota bacterium]
MEIVHRSVLQEEIFKYLKPLRHNALMIDATIGEGGHSELFLQRIPDIRIVGVDADPEIIEIAKERLKEFNARIQFFNIWFNTFFKEYPLGEERPDIILFDLGISTYHFEKSKRGFSFQKDEALDMRLDSSLEISAADVINQYPEKEIADIFYEYGEEVFSKKIAHAVCRARKQKRIDTSKELGEIIRRAVPPDKRHRRSHPATRCFQALRIVVNGELARLDAVLGSALKVLKVGGRMGVVSFHSLEDRITKTFFKEKNMSCTCPPEWPMCKCGGKQIVELITKRAVKPGKEEIIKNPSSRSARFRIIEKIAEEEL